MRTYRLLSLLLIALTLQGNSLKEAAARKGVDLGTAVDARYLADAAYAGNLAQHFSQITPENDMKWRIVHPQPGVYSFAAADAIVSFAAQHGLKVRGHTLTGDTQLPAWLKDSGFDASRMRGLLQDHISTVVKRYAGRVYAWDVLNEGYNENGTLKDDIWFNRPGIGLPGTGYMEMALRWAHAADPAARLFYNDNDDTGQGITPKADAIYRMAKDFLARGVPLHGIGLQMHVTPGSLSISGLEANIKRLTDLGLEVQITELDVRLPVNSSGNASAGDLAAQALVYHDVVAACLKFQGCKAVQTWGFTDRYSWVPGGFPGFGAALPLDANYRPKPAWDAILRALAAPPARNTSEWYQITANQFRNAASQLTGPIAPGGLLRFGAPAGPGNLAGATPKAGNYPTELAGMRVTFDGVPAPILAAQNGFALVVAPYEIAGRPTTAVQFHYLGNSSNVAELAVVPSAPALFTAASSGTGAGMILDRNFVAVSATNRARSGDLVFLTITGEGAISPHRGVTGLSSTYSVFTPHQPVTVGIGGLPAPVAWIWTGPAGLPGITQVAIVVPFGLPPGDAAVVVKAGNAVSQPGVTISIQ